MGRRLIEVYPSRALVLGGAVMLGLFGIVSFFFRGSESGTDQLSLAAGIFAYAFIAFAILVGVLAWTGRGVRDAHGIAERFLQEDAAIGREVGKPVDVTLRPRRTVASERGGRLTIPADVGGPLGLGTATVAVEREGESWRVVESDFTLDEDAIPPDPG